MVSFVKYCRRKINIRRLSLFLLVSVIMLFQETVVDAQEIHFSQYYAAPLLTNPANTGMSGDNLRIANIYRNQWPKIGDPFQTISTSVDGRLNLFNQSFGIGGLVLHDQSSAFNLAANVFLMSFSYSRILNNQLITIGLQPGFVLKSYNLEDLTFGTQFDQANQFFNSTLPTMENGLDDKLHYFDLNAGISWQMKIRHVIPSAGISLSHLNMPVERFSTSSSGTRLPVKLTFNSEITVPVNSRINAIPVMLYSYTPGANEFLIGSRGEYSLNNTSMQINELYAITMLRINPVRNFDAFILGGGIKFMTFNLGLTYDFNISPLHTVTNFNGAFEISLIYTGGKGKPGSVYQPCYIIN
jgi:type IX secretion system PorP/SprF family membrane protein